MKKIVVKILIGTRITGIIGIFISIFIFSYTILPFVISLTIYTISTLLIRLVIKIEDKKIKAFSQSIISRLKSQNNFITVNFEDCKIISNRITDEEGKNIGITENVLLYDTENDSYKSHSILKDSESLKIALNLKGTTKIYIDKDFPKLYYFDLEFLDLINTKMKNVLTLLLIIPIFNSCRSEAYNIGYNAAKHLCEIREYELNGGDKADKFTPDEIVKIKMITESNTPEFEDYIKGYKMYTKECEHEEYLLDQLERTKIKREKLINEHH